jgi:predicted dehydrogenase
MSEEATLDLVPEFRLDDTTAPLFRGKHRVSSYDMSFEEIDRKLIALELEDFAGAIRDGREPEVTGRVGLNALALTYAFLESGALHQAVTFADVVEDRVNAYQQEINEAVGL